MPYNTGNAIGSIDARDLYDNAVNLDKAVNQSTSRWTDRLGVSRPSWAGMSHYNDLGAYAASLVITGYNEIFLHEGEYYRAAAVTVLPYTTTGSWSEDGIDFVPIGDAALRQDITLYADTTIGSYRNAVNCNQHGGLEAALSDSDTLGKVVIVTDGQTISNNITVSGRALTIEYGGLVTVAATKTFTINGPFTAPLAQVFAGTGTVTFTNAADWNDHNQKSATITVHPEWWGDGAGALQLAAYSIAGQTASSTSPTYFGGVVSLANTHYKIEGTLIIPDHVVVQGASPEQRQAAIVATGTWTASNPVVRLGRVLGSQYWSHGAQIRNCTVDANFKANTGIYSASANENTGVSGVIVRNFLFQGISLQDTYAGGTDPRTMHTFIEYTDIFAPVASQAAYYPNPEQVFGVIIDSTGSEKTNPNSFSNFSLDKITVSSSSGQDDETPILIGAGFKFSGVQGVSLTNSHSEYAAVDVMIGGTYPAENIRVEQFDGYSLSPITIQINHASSNNIVLENIYSNGSATATIQDNRTGNGHTITEDYVTRYSVGRQWFVSKSTDANGSFQFTRGHASAYTPASNRTAVFEDGASIGLVDIVGATGSQLTFANSTTPANSSNINNDATGIFTFSSAVGRYSFAGVPERADNAAALTSGMTAGMIYKTSTGALMIVY